MKKLLLVFGLSLLLAAGVSAQGYYHGGGRYYARPRVSVGVGIGPYFPAYPYYGFGYSPYFGYPPFGYGYPMGYSYGYRYSRPTKLDLQIQDIRSDYNERISLAKHDKSIKRKERKKRVHELEHERDKAIIQAQKDYYERPQQRRHNFNSNNN
ncbi:hypothetical protein A4H97_21915 [Niastella yeongjuensis]|uniref:Uncharacterized protein n=1 Tax=Niastella yeongjuensis TaxID=354355 RepID=A0A1V9F884_9BACT|nr:hypothetical protein [Niastella yeongjuensis]OQP54623.1 hypothetical protein A4H97_21915 [Niastella yeongjuensis]SEO01325.1 hypothetical protein SAMN05660816_01898 [Niastella yeongjuensis]